MIFLSVLSLLSWVSVGLKSSTEVIGLILALVQLGLGIGIIMKKEIARLGYIIASSILLIFSLFGTFNYIHQQNQVDKVNNPQLTSLQNTIQNYQNDSSLSLSRKATILKSLQKSEAVVISQQISLNEVGKTMIPLRNVVVGYLIAILPIAFLTRSRVKKVFSQD